MKHIVLFIAISFCSILSGQSIRNGVNEEYFNTLKAEDFDLAGVWQANRFEVVYDSVLSEVVRFEFKDSISNVVFVRYSMDGDVFYKLTPLNPADTAVLGQITIMADNNKFLAFSEMNTKMKYEHFSDAIIYGPNALQLNIDVPESTFFFNQAYKSTEDLNVFWEFIRHYPE